MGASHPQSVGLSFQSQYVVYANIFALFAYGNLFQEGFFKIIIKAQLGIFWRELILQSPVLSK